jgi:hypothetical protein
MEEHEQVIAYHILAIKAPLNKRSERERRYHIPFGTTSSGEDLLGLFFPASLLVNRSRHFYLTL